YRSCASWFCRTRSAAPTPRRSPPGPTTRSTPRSRSARAAPQRDMPDAGGVTISLDGRVALITGAGAGIGRATALLLSRAGAAIGVNDIDAERARSTADEIM